MQMSIHVCCTIPKLEEWRNLDVWGFREGGSFFRREPVQHIQNPLAKRLGYRRAGQHAHKMASTH